MIKKIISLIIVSNSFTSVTAQTNQITGKVVDQAGNPIPYASIIFKGTNMFGTWTTIDGKFDTYIPEGADSVICTHINFNKTVEKITNSNYIILVLAKKKQDESIIVIPSTLSLPKKDTPNPVVEEARHFSKIEINASFPGGEKNLEKYLKENIVYPDSVSINNINGFIKVGFTINIDGYPKNVLLLRGINKYADEAVIKAILNMPKWKPALQNGHTIEFYKELSIAFTIK